MTMKGSVLIVAIAVLAVSRLGGGTLARGQGDSCYRATAKRNPTLHASMSPAFYPVKSAGQLCDHRTAATLNLDREKQVRWNKVVHNYNHAVKSAQGDLVREAAKFLSPEEVE